MSKHSKNNTASSVFTYRERQQLRGVYGSLETRVGQDSIKKFEMCTICNNRLIEATCCQEGHMFCRSCVIQFLVKQKKKISEQHQEVEKNQKREINQKREKQIEKEVEKIEAFQKYDGFLQITDRKELIQGSLPAEKVNIGLKDIKPIGIYELNPKKTDYVKTAFWTLENTPQFQAKPTREQKIVKCPGGNHKLTLKKLRDIKLKDVDGQFCCWICTKDVQRQRVGAYKCGHLVCLGCKSNRCEICDQLTGWMEIQRGSSSFAAHNKAEVKVYTHAFIA